MYLVMDSVKGNGCVQDPLIQKEYFDQGRVNRANEFVFKSCMSHLVISTSCFNNGYQIKISEYLG
jgi:hypothetical protein